jgi:hypothetical protein
MPLQRPRPRGNSGRLCQALLHWFKSRKAAQVGRFSGSSLDARASLKLSSWPVCGRAHVSFGTPVSKIRRVGFPLPFQTSDSIGEGLEGRNHPTPESTTGASRRRQAAESCRQPS